MKVTSLVMAIIGTVFGIIFGLFAMAVGGASNAVGSDGTAVIWLGASAIAACVFGMLCSGFHFGGRRQGLMTLGLFVAAVWHLISISAFGIMGFLFFLMAAIFAFFGRAKSRGGEAAGSPDAGRSLPASQVK